MLFRSDPRTRQPLATARAGARRPHVFVRRAFRRRGRCDGKYSLAAIGQGQLWSRDGLASGEGVKQSAGIGLRCGHRSGANRGSDHERDAALGALHAPPGRTHRRVQGCTTRTAHSNTCAGIQRGRPWRMFRRRAHDEHGPAFRTMRLPPNRTGRRADLRATGAVHTNALWFSIGHVPFPVVPNRLQFPIAPAACASSRSRVM